MKKFLSLNWNILKLIKLMIIVNGQSFNRQCDCLEQEENYENLRVKSFVRIQVN